MSVLAQLMPVRQRMRLRTLLWAMSSAAVAAAMTRVAALSAGDGPRSLWIPFVLPLIAAACVAAVVVRRARSQWHWLHVADAVEAAYHDCANCVRALVDVELQRVAVTASAHARLNAVVSERLATVSPARVVPLRVPLAVLLCAFAGALTIVTAAPAVVPSQAVPATISAASPMQVTVKVIPPAYLNEDAREVRVEGVVPVPAGASVLLRVSTPWPTVWVETPAAGAAPNVTRVDGDAWVSAPIPLTSSRVMVVAAGASPADLRESRVVSLVVSDDAAPQVTIDTPGRDTVRSPGATDPLPVRVTASDDHQLAALELRFVRLAGGGETFTFTEGTVPLVRTVASPRAWTADARWAIGALALERGESLVYRAAVRDSRPGSDWVFSDSYVVDTGTSLEASGAGADLPEEDRRYAISQQMVIVKTERLLAQGSAIADAARLEQAQMLAAEQRRVRAEVVFLSGGDIADEVEEAEHSHELQEGRLENVGRAEMVRAMAEMSRAESALTAGDLRAALRFERAALGALQRAFDRRRYFLRTPTERTRIDQSRRLAGDRRGAMGGARSAASITRPGEGALDALARATEQVQTVSAPSAALMAQLVALDPDDHRWRMLVDEWGAEGTRQTDQASRQALVEWLRSRQIQLLPPASGGLPPVIAGNGFANDARARRPR